MYHLIVRGKKEKALFSGLIFNDNKQLEFTSCNLPFFKNKTFVFDEEKGGLWVKGTEEKILIRISTEQVLELLEIKNKIMEELSVLYKNILAGEEKLICLNIGVEGYSYLITTETILEAEIYSPKYIKALEYSFSDKCLKKYLNLESYPHFQNYEDMQERLGKAIINLGLKPNDAYNGEEVIKTTLTKILKGVI